MTAITCPVCKQPFVPGQRIKLSPCGVFQHAFHVRRKPADEQPIPGAPSDPDPQVRA